MLILMRSRLVMMILMILLIGAFGIQATAAQETIARSFSNLTLGMSIEELQKSYKTQEIEETALLPGERLFTVTGQFNGISKVLCTFYLGKLFRIELYYSPQYSRQVPWEQFVEFVKKGYGEGWGFESTKGPTMIWNDRKTSFILELKNSPNSSPFYIASIVDDELYNTRQESCSSPKFKV